MTSIASSSSSDKLLRILFLGPLRVILQMENCTLPCPSDGSQATLWSSLLERFPSLEVNRSSIRFARNNQFLQSQDLLEPGDEIALIPPVSGG